MVGIVCFRHTLRVIRLRVCLQIRERLVFWRRRVLGRRLTNGAFERGLRFGLGCGIKVTVQIISCFSIRGKPEVLAPIEHHGVVRVINIARRFRRREFPVIARASQRVRLGRVARRDRLGRVVGFQECCVRGVRWVFCSAGSLGQRFAR